MKSSSLVVLPFVVLAPIAFIMVLGGKRGPQVPGGVDPVDEAYLRLIPTSKNDDDRAFDRWLAEDPTRPPYVEEDTARVTSRSLTPYEKWALGPYFYVDDLTVPRLHNGKIPTLLEGIEVPWQMLALTMSISGKPHIFVPHEPQDFRHRWWLALLAHELYHAGQLRLGATPGEAEDAIKRHGYVNSPLEISARGKQREVYLGLAQRARAFLKGRPVA